MPPAERWAGLTTIALLGLGATLPGCAALYDALGRVVRAEVRAGLTLLALVPALYAAYALAVRELTPQGFVAACLFAAVPGAAAALSGQRRLPTVYDAVACVYLAASLWLGLLPRLTLPQQGGLVLFFELASVPLLLVLFAMRGWPGLGFTWHLSLRELRDALLAALPAAALLGAYGLATGSIEADLGGAGGMALAAVSFYFFLALPAELLLRGGLQNGLERALRGPMGATAKWVALAAAAALSALSGALQGGGVYNLVAYLAIGLAAGWTYQRTGKLSASALTHMLIIWLTGLIAMAV